MKDRWWAGLLVGISLVVPAFALQSCVRDCNNRLDDGSYAKGAVTELARQIERLERRVNRLESRQ